MAIVWAAVLLRRRQDIKYTGYGGGHSADVLDVALPVSDRPFSTSDWKNALCILVDRSAAANL